jgi:hypothetical protein
MPPLKFWKDPATIQSKQRKTTRVLHAMKAMHSQANRSLEHTTAFWQS